MARTSGDKTWKITETQRRWASDEQIRIERLGDRGITQAELFALMIAKYESATPEAKRFKSYLDVKQRLNSKPRLTVVKPSQSKAYRPKGEEEIG